jgi:AbrB family transcriptional regulator, transcriptional pleiotropic regulator of transition state genes
MTRSNDDEFENVGAKGVARRIDSLGRVVVPMAYRKVFGIRDGDLLDLTLEGDGIVLRKLASTCGFCGSSEELGMFKAGLVCAPCVVELAALAGENPSSTA